jgi:hypothetical protein
MILGHRGVELYKNVRKSMSIGGDVENTEDHCSSSSESSGGYGVDDDLTQCTGSDRFYNASSKDVSQAVVQWHEYLRESLRVKDRITAQILDVIETNMLQKHPRDRLPAKKIYERMLSILNQAEDKETASSCYRFPLYFAVAKRAEQAKEAKELKIILSSRADASSNSKYKSKYFNNHAFQEATREPLGAAEYEDLHDQTPDGRRDGQCPGPFERKGFSCGPLDLDPDSGKFPHISYYHARRLLEEDGWQPGTLERVREIGTGPSSPVPLRVARESTLVLREQPSLTRVKSALITRIDRLGRRRSRRGRQDDSPHTEPEASKVPANGYQPSAINTTVKGSSMWDKWLTRHYKGRDIVSFFVSPNG